MKRYRVWLLSVVLGLAALGVLVYLLASSGISYAETLLFTIIRAFLHYLSLFLLFLIVVLAFLPGQFGLLEGSLSAVYAAFGIPFSVALGAALLYRLSYSLFPFAAGFVLLPRLMKQALTAVSESHPQ